MLWAALTGQSASSHLEKLAGRSSRMGNYDAHGNIHGRLGRFEERSRSEPDEPLGTQGVDAERVGVFLARACASIPRNPAAPLKADEIAQPGITVLAHTSVHRPGDRRRGPSLRALARRGRRGLRWLRQLLRRLG